MTVVSKEKYDELVSNGKKAYLTNNFEEAVNCLSEACAIGGDLFGDLSPESFEALFYYGQSLTEVCRLQQEPVNLDSKAEQEPAEAEEKKVPTDEEKPTVPVEESETPAEAEKPTEESETPADAEKPAKKAETPADAGKPAETSDTPSHAEKPAEEVETPADVEKPAETSDTPTDAEKPAEEAEIPADAEKPTEPVAENETPAEEKEVLADAEKSSEACEEKEVPADAGKSTEPAAEDETPADAEKPAEEMEVPADAEKPAEEMEVSADTENPGKAAEEKEVLGDAEKPSEPAEKVETSEEATDEVEDEEMQEDEEEPPSDALLAFETLEVCRKICQNQLENASNDGKWLSNKADVLLALCESAVVDGRPDQAREAIAECIETLKTMPSICSRRLSQAHMYSARACMAADAFADAAKEYKQAHDILQEYRNSMGTDESSSKEREELTELMGNIKERMEDAERSEESFAKAKEELAAKFVLPASAGGETNDITSMIRKGTKRPAEEHAVDDVKKAKTSDTEEAEVEKVEA
ncbi:hypothetical protein QR680_005930 [Steinernema hermaphroditum]|uniref:Tetratricopeptide SHNi-TPR domain-containing protein n=1 Tax=Steinernema hermaphroditum TaxID=289476 RepID=A0AA39HTR7_9BILA|nr:hypothetical protein QR680_005930 [Steinernema hermaphroditum]